MPSTFTASPDGSRPEMFVPCATGTGSSRNMDVRRKMGRFLPETGYLESNYDKELCPKRTSFNMYFEFHVLQLTRFCKLSSSYFMEL